MQQPSEHVPAPAPPSAEPSVATLTPRECEVAALVAEGLSNAEIGQRLVITPGTVSNHIAHIMRALGARNRVHVAMWAVEQGLYQLGRPHRSGRAEDIAPDAS